MVFRPPKSIVGTMSRAPMGRSAASLWVLAAADFCYFIATATNEPCATPWQPKGCVRSSSTSTGMAPRCSLICNQFLDQRELSIVDALPVARVLKAVEYNFHIELKLGIFFALICDKAGLEKAGKCR